MQWGGSRAAQALVRHRKQVWQVKLLSTPSLHRRENQARGVNKGEKSTLLLSFDFIRNRVCGFSLPVLRVCTIMEEGGDFIKVWFRRFSGKALFLDLENKGFGLFVSVFKDMWQQKYPVKSYALGPADSMDIAFFFSCCKLTQISALFDSLFEHSVKENHHLLKCMSMVLWNEHVSVPQPSPNLINKVIPMKAGL